MVVKTIGRAQSERFEMPEVAAFSAVELDGGPAQPLEHPGSLRLSASERLDLLAQLSMLIDSGIQIPAALHSMRIQSGMPRTARALEHLESVVASGRSLSQGMEELPRAFPAVIVHVVRAAETGGLLSDMLERLVTTLEEEAQLKHRIRSACIYPAAMLSLSIVVVTFLLAFIVPRFRALFRGKESILPVPTKILMAFSEVITSYGFYILGAAALSATALVLYLRSPAGRVLLDRTLLRLPVIGSLYQLSCIARAARTLGLLFHSGVPVLAALDHTAEVAGSPSFEALWRRVREAVSDGSRISAALASSTLLPATFRQLVLSGDESGQLDRVLMKSSEHYSSDVKRKIGDAMAMLEPMMVVFMGVLVGFIALSIMLPIFKLSRGI